MVRKSGKQNTDSGNDSESKRNLDDDIDALFRLPAAEFITARNALAAQLKKDGHGSDADLVKALGKPSITAWAVNQLYWNHREAFDRLIATGERFRQAQTSRLAQKIADMRTALDERREELANLSNLATSVLRAAGHNPTPDTIHRIMTTLEAVSAYASSDAPRPGRLSNDVDPPGFDSLASFVPSAGTSKSSQEKQPVVSSAHPSTSTNRKAQPTEDIRKIEEKRKADIAAAKLSLRNAKSMLSEAQAKAQKLESAQKKANEEVKEADKQRRQAEERLQKAMAASEEAARRARSITVDLEQATKAVDDAKGAFDKASKGLELLSRG